MIWEIKMTREIKFRAWDKKNKSFITNDDEFKEYMIGLDGKFYRMDFHSGVSGYENGNLIWNELEDIVLMQYTGIKDKNGKEIYEGDIVSIEHIYYEGIAQYDSRLKESFKEIGNYVCKYDEGRFVFGNGYNNLEIHNFWKWSQEKEFYYAIGDFVKKNDRFGYFSKEYFRFLALEGNKFENPELLKGEKND